MVAITAIGIEISARLQWFLLGFEYLMLVVFSVVALVKVYSSSPPGSIHPSISWFVPNMNAGALAGGVLLALFIYWGWDTAVSVNEETENKSIVPGLAAVLSTVALVFIYVLATTAAQAFRGPAYLENNAERRAEPARLGRARLDALQSADRRRAHLGGGVDADHDPAGRPHDALDGDAQGDPGHLRAG